MKRKCTSSVLVRVIAASAERLAQTLHVPDADVPSFKQTVERELYGQWATRFSGESVRLRVYVAKESAVQRALRRNRILQALRAGDAPRSIAKRESVSPSWVLRLAKTIDRT